MTRGSTGNHLVGDASPLSLLPGENEVGEKDLAHPVHCYMWGSVVLAVKAEREKKTHWPPDIYHFSSLKREFSKTFYICN